MKYVTPLSASLLPEVSYYLDAVTPAHTVVEGLKMIFSTTL